jgi:VanZ family protein
MMSTPVRRAWALSLLWVGVIALESFGGSSENTAHLFYPLLQFLFPKFSLALISDIHDVIRKFGHFFGYCVLSVTLYRSWWTTLASRATPNQLSWRDMFRAWRGRAVLLALLGTLAVAGLDEFHQSFTPGRTGRVVDVLLDEIGGVFGQAAIGIGSSVPARRKRPDPQPTISS